LAGPCPNDGLLPDADAEAAHRHRARHPEEPRRAPA